MFSKVGLRPEKTPQRVYALLKLVDYKNGLLKKEEICNYIQPNNIQKNSEIFNTVFELCEINNFIAVDFDGKVILKIDADVLKNECSFRKFITKLVCNNATENTFYLITEKIISTNVEIYNESSFENISKKLNLNKITKEDVLGWRFWAAYLGYGFILNGQFVINPQLKIKDFIEENFNDDSNKKITLRLFIQTLVERCPEFARTIDGNNIDTHLTIALLTLESLNAIKLIDMNDFSEVWSLNLNNKSKDVTHIEFLGGK